MAIIWDDLELEMNEMKISKPKQGWTGLPALSELHDVAQHKTGTSLLAFALVICI